MVCGVVCELKLNLSLQLKNESSLERCAMFVLWWRELPLNHTNEHIHQSFFPLINVHTWVLSTKEPVLAMQTQRTHATSVCRKQKWNYISSFFFFLFFFIYRLKAPLIISRKWSSPCLLWQRTSRTAHTHTAWLGKTVQMAFVSFTSIPTMLVDTGIILLTSMFWGDMGQHA